MKFNFNIGNKKPTISHYAILGLILSGIMGALSQCTKIDEKSLWDLFDEAQRSYVPGTLMNDFIIKDPEKLQRRITRDVDRAIENVSPEYDRIIEKDNQKYSPKYFERKNDESSCYSKECKALGPPMRLCAPWYWDCPRGLDKGS